LLLFFYEDHVYFLSDFIVGESIDLVASLSTLRCCFANATPLLRYCFVVDTWLRPFSTLLWLLSDRSSRFSRRLLLLLRTTTTAAGSDRNAFSPVLLASVPSAADSHVKGWMSPLALRHFYVISASFLC